ncbi:MAG: aspartate kinase [Vulcanibacillus sp.]
MKVSKFGGTSLATANQIKKVFNIVVSDSERKIIVVSAPGKRFDDDIKVTDLLINYAEKYLNSKDADYQLNLIIARYEEICVELNLNKDIIDNLLSDLKNSLTKDFTNYKKETAIETIKSFGEDYCAKMVTYFFQSKEIDANYINPKEAGMFLSNGNGYAQVLPESYKHLSKLKDSKGIVIFPGFFGYSLDGNIVTFSRGGSDITGSILAAAVEADMYENFTDVDSVFVVNPKIISNPLSIKELTYNEMRELSYAGFCVFNEEALMPAYLSKIPVNIKNTNNPDSPGTKIVLQRNAVEEPVIGIASDSGFCSIYVSKYLMNREIGFGRKLLKILEDEGLSYEHLPSGIDNISIILREKQLNNEIEERIKKIITTELSIDHMKIQRDLTLIMIVGEGMRHTIGIAAKATKALSEAYCNIEMINQGSSEISMMFGIKRVDEEKAIKALYNEFFIR